MLQPSRSTPKQCSLLLTWFKLTALMNIKRKQWLMSKRLWCVVLLTLSLDGEGAGSKCYHWAHTASETNTQLMQQSALIACYHTTMQQGILIVPNIYTTKIDTFVCPPHISETVAVRIMKLAHRSRIASTTKKIISKMFYCPFYQFYCKQFKRIGT